MTEILVLTEKIELLEERAAEMQYAFDTLRDSLNQLEAKLAEIEDAVCRLDMDVDERVTDVQRSAEYDIDELRNSLDDLSRRVEAMDDFLTVVDERDAEEDGRIGFEIHGLEERIAALEQDRA